MSMKCSSFIPRALIVSGVLFGVVLVAPASHAGEGAMTLRPVEDTDMPEGSQIPKRRMQEIEGKMRDYKAKVRQEAPAKQQETAPQKEAPKPDADPQ